MLVVRTINFTEQTYQDVLMVYKHDETHLKVNVRTYKGLAEHPWLTQEIVREAISGCKVTANDNPVEKTATRLALALNVLAPKGWTVRVTKETH